MDQIQSELSLSFDALIIFFSSCDELGKLGLQSDLTTDVKTESTETRTLTTYHLDDIEAEALAVEQCWVGNVLPVSNGRISFQNPKLRRIRQLLPSTLTRSLRRMKPTRLLLLHNIPSSFSRGHSYRKLKRGARFWWWPRSNVDSGVALITLSPSASNEF